MKAYLIPGAFEDIKSRNYQAVLDVYKNLGYQPKFIKIDWKYKTIDDWVQQTKLAIPKKDLENSLLSGFSYGAVTALVLAARVANPKTLLLFSLSARFKEDIHKLKPKALKKISKRRLKDFEELSFEQLAAKINCSTSIFIGAKEQKEPVMKNRSRDAKTKIPSSQLIVIDGVNHDVGDPLYVAAIKKVLNQGL